MDAVGTVLEVASVFWVLKVASRQLFSMAQTIRGEKPHLLVELVRSTVIFATATLVVFV